ncbi:MobA/MobL family protein, partial [Neorhizobium sp. T786]|uniref:MobA/MobL family protein n=1 Tax=Pseudorhizobium xiangyangii TaxID=2883104 RepID=UPI001CFFCF3F
MAIPHFRAQIITAGRSAVDAAAYRHRTRMVDEAVGSSTKRYDRDNDLVFSEVAIPENAPKWIKDMV